MLGSGPTSPPTSRFFAGSRAPSLAILAAGWGATLLLAAAAASASIALELTSTSKIEEEQMVVDLVIENVGDEAAHALVPALSFDGRAQRGEAHTLLQAGEILRRQAALPFAAPTAGRWPVVVTIDYTDANGYLLQALQVSTVEAGQPPPGGLLISAIEAPELAERGKVSIAIKNMTAAPQAAELELVVAQGVEIDHGPVAVSLDGWAEDSVSFELVNRSALAGSRLPIFAVLEWDQAEAHHTAVGNGVLAIVEGRPLLGRFRVLALVGVALLLLAGSVLWLRRRAPGGRSPGEP